MCKRSFLHNIRMHMLRFGLKILWIAGFHMLPPYTRINNENIVIMITKKETYFKRFPISKCGRWDLNPHVRNEHKILSLARLPVPTLPHIISRRLDYNIKSDTKCQRLFRFYLEEKFHHKKMISW